MPNAQKLPFRNRLRRMVRFCLVLFIFFVVKTIFPPVDCKFKSQIYYYRARALIIENIIMVYILRYNRSSDGITL